MGTWEEEVASSICIHFLVPVEAAICPVNVVSITVPEVLTRYGHRPDFKGVMEVFLKECMCSNSRSGGPH